MKKTVTSIVLFAVFITFLLTPIGVINAQPGRVPHYSDMPQYKEMVKREQDQAQNEKIRRIGIIIGIAVIAIGLALGLNKIAKQQKEEKERQMKRDEKLDQFLDQKRRDDSSSE